MSPAYPRQPSAKPVTASDRKAKQQWEAQCDFAIERMRQNRAHLQAEEGPR